MNAYNALYWWTWPIIAIAAVVIAIAVAVVIADWRAQRNHDQPPTEEPE